MLSLSETESTCPSPRQFSNATSSETIADVSSDYVDPPSKSTTASNDLSSNDDAIEYETSEIVPKKINLITGHLILGLFQKKIPRGGWGVGGGKANDIFFYGWLVLTFFKLYGSLVFEKI